MSEEQKLYILAERMEIMANDDWTSRANYQEVIKTLVPILRNYLEGVDD